jgi:hypothetical protein
LKGTPQMRVKIWGGFTSCHDSVEGSEVGSVWAFALLPGETHGADKDKGAASRGSATEGGPVASETCVR